MKLFNPLKSIQSSEPPVIVIAITTVIAIAISIFYLFSREFIIFQNILYVPMIIACVYYAQKGLVFSISLSAAYFLLVVAFTRDAVIIRQALVRFCMFLGVAGVTIVASRVKLKHADAAMRDAVARYRSLFDHSTDGILIIDPAAARPIEFNETAHKQLGYSRKEFNNLSLFDLNVDETSAETRSHIDYVLNVGYDDFETRQRTKQGEIRNVHVTAQIIEIMKQKYCQCVWHDITNRKRMEELYRNAVESSLAAMFIVQNGKICFTNNTALLYSGYAPEELIGESSDILAHPEDRERVQLKNREILLKKSVRPYQFRIVTKDGKIKWVLQIISPIQYEGKRAILGNAIDITDRRQALESLRESEEQYRMLFENMAQGVFFQNANGTLIDCNPAVLEMFGLTHDQFIKRTSTDTSWKAIHEDGSEFLVEEHPSMLALRTGKSVRGVVAGVINARKNDYVWLNINAIPLFKKKGYKPYRVFVTLHDITERKQAEEKLKRSLENIRNALGVTVHVMSSAVEARDPYTATHQTQSADLARAIATEMELPREQIDAIRMAGSIHDIGKLSIPAEILSKPTKLSEVEYSLIKEHALKGYEILKEVESPCSLAEIVYQHHERMDGSGYPRKLKEDEILIEARVLAVADVVESMASHRPYRPALGIDKALEEIEKNRGILYDTAVVDACIRLFRKNGVAPVSTGHLSSGNKL